MAEILKKTPHIFTSLKKKMNRKKGLQGKGKYLVFRGSEKNYVRNGAWVVEESISLFHGRANPLRHLSVDDLNNMNVEPLQYHEKGFHDLYQGFWEGRVVLVKKPNDNRKRYDYDYAESYLREIVVATQMATHNNVHKILGCCLETDIPVVVYEWMPPETLQDRVLLNDENQSKAVLEWKDRLRIAWEISHVVAYLHNAFPRPIIHSDLKPSNVFLDQHNAANLADFSLSISIPEGKESVRKGTSGTFGYIAPEKAHAMKISKGSDVYSFGMLLLVLLTGKKPFPDFGTEQNGIKNNLVREIIDPAIIRNGVTSIEDLQLRASAQLAIRCVSEEADYRPPMVEVATQLKSMITSPESIPTATNFQENGVYWRFYGSEEGSEEYIVYNEACLLKESFSLFRDSAHPICHYFSIHELNSMNVELDQVFQYYYRGTWEGKAVMVKLSSYSDENQRSFVREILVATKMLTYNNVQKLLGCCLETKLPVLVYEWREVETLQNRIFLKDENHTPLEWKDRLRIAWEISDVVSHLHTAFPRPIIYGSLDPDIVFLDQDNTVKFFNFYHSVPKGEYFMSWTRYLCYLAPEYRYRALAESTDVYSFGMLFLELLTGMDADFRSIRRGKLYGKQINLVDWITEKIRMGHIREIVDPAIAINNGVTTTELIACIELALRCTNILLNSRPTMVDIAIELNNIIRSHESIPSTSTFREAGMYMIFHGSNEYYIQNKSIIDEESNSLFSGKMNLNPIHYFSVDELCKLNVEYYRIFWNEDCNWYQGYWEGSVVFVKLPNRFVSDEIRLLLREILVASQMASHNNVQKLIGCCLETEYPVLVYESVAEESLEDRILLKDENQSKAVLEWKEWLRIAWEICDAVSHLHNAFPRPIIHRYLETANIFLDLDNTVKLSNFRRSISIPEGQNFVEDSDDFGRKSCYMESDKDERVRVAECTDVYSFGILFLVLLTGKSACFEDTIDEGRTRLLNWVTEKFKKVSISEIVDPAIIKSGVTTTEMTASVKLALRCTAKRGKRPTMVDVATELEKIIRSSDLPKTVSLYYGAALLLN